jgi:hypothetical protein
VIFAVENNRLMLDMLKRKYQKFLRPEPSAGGIVTPQTGHYKSIRDGGRLFRFRNFEQCAYAVPDADSCLAECCRVLKPGGELCLSGQEGYKLDILFDRIAKDLKDNGTFEELQADYNLAYQINELKFSPMIYHWTTKEVEAMILNAGFKATVHASEDVYACQSMFLCAVKSVGKGGNERGLCLCSAAHSHRLDCQARRLHK